MNEQEILEYIKQNYHLKYHEISEKLQKEKGIYKPSETIRNICRKYRGVIPYKKITSQIKKDDTNIKTVIFIADVHLDASLPNYSKSYALVKQFAKINNIDTTVILGDFLDFNAISKFSETKPRERENKRLKKDFDMANKELDFWCKISKDKVIFIEGNHEHRIQYFLDQIPSLEGLLEIPKQLKIEERDNMEFVEMNIEKRLYNSNLYAVHGAYHTINHSKKHMETYNLPHLVYGHLHSRQVYTKPTRKICYTAESIGCLCDLNPRYLKNKPSTFQNGFGLAYINIDDGSHTFYNIAIENNQFIYNGKTYKYEEEQYV